jgi:cytidine deaminase
MDEGTMVRTAYTLFEHLYDATYHRVICLAHTGKGFYQGISLNSSGQDVCAEPIALANARMSGANDVDWIVSIIHSAPDDPAPRVASPCGNCRQLFQLYCPTAKVIVAAEESGYLVMKPQELLPFAFTKTQLGAGTVFVKGPR